MAVLKCAKCESTHVVLDARVLGIGPHAPVVCVGVARNPDAWILKAEETADVRARVCADCGHLELFVRGARALYKGHMESTTTIA